MGDKLREVFHTGNVNILWWDDKTDLVQVHYRYEHGRPGRRACTPPCAARAPRATSR